MVEFDTKVLAERTPLVRVDLHDAPEFVGHIHDDFVTLWNQGLTYFGEVGNGGDFPANLVDDVKSAPAQGSPATISSRSP